MHLNLWKKGYSTEDTICLFAHMCELSNTYVNVLYHSAAPDCYHTTPCAIENQEVNFYTA
jgi:hypothetical protein